MKTVARKCYKCVNKAGRYQKCLWYGSIASCSVIAAINFFLRQYGKMYITEKM